MTGASPLPGRNRLTGAWVAVTILTAILACGGVVALHYVQQQALDRYTRTIGAFRQARIDLYQGFLHVSLSGGADSPWQREQGVALLAQAAADFERLLSQMPLEIRDARESAERLGAFRALLREEGDPRFATRREVELRARFHHVESMVVRLDAEARKRLLAIRAEDHRRFGVVLILAAAFLALVSGGMLRASRGQAASDVARAEAVRRAKADSDRFEKIFNATLAPTTIVTASDGRFLAVNDAFLRLSGYAREDLIGHTVPEASLWAEPAQRIAFVQRLRDGQRVTDYEMKMRLRSGEVRDGLLSSDVTEFME